MRTSEVRSVPVNFIFALHFHQPHGQFKWVSERIFENSYEMLLDVLKKYSDLKFTVHISGPLLLYLKDNHSEWLEELFRLGDIGTVEFMGGTIGEAILPLVPSNDRVEQVTRYFELFEKISGIRPRGVWLPERVWEPWMPETMARAGVEYTLVDDAVLVKSGYPRDSALYAWIVEEGGYSVKVLFIDEGVRYILPWKRPQVVLDYIASRSSHPSAVVIWGSDAEKFGEWMSREASRAWLEEFLERLRGDGRIRLVHPSEYLRESGVRGYLYLDSGSYDKMLEWSWGFVRNFLYKYAESKNMYSKALWVKKKLSSAYRSQREIPLDYYLAQCNDAYWHGLFGGVYLAHLRQAIYESLIRVEREAEEIAGYYSETPVKRTLVDFDLDGRDELLVETPTVNLYIELSDGGTLFEFDVKRKGLEHNVQDTVTRYPEPYLPAEFRPDWYRRVSWRVHVWGLETRLEDWVSNTPFKDMSDLALAQYRVAFSEEPRELHLRAVGGVYYYGVKACTVLVEKAVRVEKSGYRVKYTVKNLGEGVLRGKLGFEYHLAWKVDREREREVFYSVNGKKYSVSEPYVGGASVVAVDSGVYPLIVLKASRGVGAWISRLSSYARTERGVREIPQGLGVMFVEDVELEKGGVYELEVEHYVEL
ncbi:MAG: alpha-amylase/4-alpha-glucanotransferase domain-containing protein [Desulfurococcaceae archaeon]